MSVYQTRNVNIDGVDIPFNSEWTKIAFSLSGGADSTLLAYLVCSLLVSNNMSVTCHVINHVRMWKTRPWQTYVFQQVYDWLTTKFPSLDFKLHTSFIAPEIEYGNIGPILTDEYDKKVSGDNIQIRAFAEYVCYTNNVAIHYNGTTRNPKDLDFGGLPSRDIDANDQNEYLRLMVHMDRLASHPFRFTEKSWIVNQYKKLNIMDLFDLTRSCEGEFKGIDYKSYTPGQAVPICNECFWCKERAWAIEQSK